MKGTQFIVEGNWGHFKRPETNNNPLTHDFITKTALIGLIGAVLGKERNAMRYLFPQLSEDLLYGVQILNPIKKESWAFTMRKAVNPMIGGAPKHMEFLKSPKFCIALALDNERSKEIFAEFVESLKNSLAKYTPVLGLHNCPANLVFVSEGEFSEKREDSFKTKGFVSNKHQLNILETMSFRIGFERIPTFQNDNFWNLPEKYVEVVYPSEKREITAKGEYFQYFNGECWWLT